MAVCAATALKRGLGLPSEVEVAGLNGVARQLVLDGIELVVERFQLPAVDSVDEDVDGRGARVDGATLDLQRLAGVGCAAELCDLEQGCPAAPWPCRGRGSP